MAIRRPSAVWPFLSFTSFSNNVSSASTNREGTRQQLLCQRCRRKYATIAGDNGQQREREPHTWPAASKGKPCPTPYQIFAMNSNAAYSKTRYYELVKLYHPDRASNAEDDISQTIRIERYRLIVAAHSILSDPMKRSAYDRFGAGWNGKAELGGRQSSSYNAPGPFSHSNDPIWKNATWEDWERFYAWRARKNGEPVYRQYQAPVYFKNTYFLALVMLLAMMGSSANYNRAHEAGAYFIEQRDVVHDRTAKELRKVKQEASHSGSRQDRVEWFLRNREATLGLSGADPETLRQEKIDRALPNREICRSEEIVEKDP